VYESQPLLTNLVAGEILEEIMPAPGCQRLATRRPTISASDVTTSGGRQSALDQATTYVLARIAIRNANRP